MQECEPILQVIAEHAMDQPKKVVERAWQCSQTFPNTKVAYLREDNKAGLVHQIDKA